MFLTPEDFNRIPYSIPDAENKSSLQPFINEYEELILRRMMGHTMYDEFVLGYESVQKYMDLSNGKNYEISTKTYRWQGMKAMLKPYIYAMWLKHTFDFHGEEGITMSKGENSTVLDPNTRIVRAWNAFAIMAGAGCRKIDSMYGFVKTNYTVDYPTFVWRDPGFMNSFNL